MTIQRFEKGTRNVSLKWLERLAELYKVTVAELVDDKTPADNSPSNISSTIDAGLLEDIINYALERCKDNPVNSKALARAITITYNRCQQEGRKPKASQIRDKVDDMLSFAAIAG